MMMRLACVAMILQGCAYIPQDAEITPTLGFMADDLGAGTTVRLIVTDERPRQTLGNRGGNGFAGATISYSGNLAAVYQASLTDMLQAKGFDVVYSTGDADSELRVDIRDLTYRTSTGFFSGGVHVNAAIKATGSSAFETYDRMYVEELEERKDLVPDKANNNEMLTYVVSVVMQKLAQDRKMMAVLAGVNWPGREVSNFGKR